jgi:hypothetical protein
MWMIMFWAVIGAAVSIILAIHDCDTWYNKLLAGTMITLVAALFGAAVMMIGNLIVMSTTDHWSIEYGEKTELVALSDQQGVAGRGYVLSYTVNSTHKYTYLYETELGITSNTIEAANAFVKTYEPAADATPYIQVCYRVHPNSIIEALFNTRHKVYLLYIPNDAIVDDYYNIDLQ